MRDPPGAIKPFFHLHVRGPDRVVNLKELPLMRDGKVVAQTPDRLEAQAPAQFPARRRGAMQIGGLSGPHRKAPVVEGQIPLHEAIGVRHGRNPRQPQFLAQPILKRLKQPFHSAFRLWRVGRDQLHPQLPQRPAKLTRRFHAGELLFDRGIGR